MSSISRCSYQIPLASNWDLYSLCNVQRTSNQSMFGIMIIHTHNIDHETLHQHYTHPRQSFKKMSCLGLTLDVSYIWCLAFVHCTHYMYTVCPCKYMWMIFIHQYIGLASTPMAMHSVLSKVEHARWSVEFSSDKTEYLHCGCGAEGVRLHIPAISLNLHSWYLPPRPILALIQEITYMYNF